MSTSVRHFPLPAVKRCANARGDYFSTEELSLLVYGYVFMTNHIHLLTQAKDNNLSDVLRDFKKFMSGRITKAIEENDTESRNAG